MKITAAYRPEMEADFAWIATDENGAQGFGHTVRSAVNDLLTELELRAQDVPEIVRHANAAEPVSADEQEHTELHDLIADDWHDDSKERGEFTESVHRGDYGND